MRARSWRWLRTRILGLLSKPPSYDIAGQPHFSTRIQAQLWTPAAVDRQQGNA